MSRNAEAPEAQIDVGDLNLNCNVHDTFVAASSVLFVLYLALKAKKNINSLCNGGSYIIASYYALLWIVTLLNLAWSFLQAWQCSPGKELAWNALTLFTTSGMLYLEISLMAFLLNVNYMNGMEAQALVHTSIVSGIIVLVDTLLKAIYVFGFGVPLFNRNVGSTHTIKWGLWTVHKLLLAAAYGFILFEHFSKWREKLPREYTYFNTVFFFFW
ncbi:transmembrane protein, putative [Medicago truncatula]|uniref:Transmembrane protein, putative n=1 Tax=Medicago truncatula TaxID=3880 RepID=A0A072UQB1_MEDTR|nr:transmembrane protein, putative [Medicago truncatula]